MKNIKFSGIIRTFFSIVLISMLIPVTLTAGDPLKTKNMEQEEITPAINQDHLVVLWTSADPEVAEKMVFMYTYNAKKNGWWKDITFIIWGPSAQLASQNKEIGESLVRMKEMGIEMLACKACADLYGCSPSLENLGLEVKYMGVALTNYIKEGKKVITF